MISNTCALIRDYSIKELLKYNQYAESTIKEICYGDGYAYIDGKLTKLGACKMKQIKIEGQKGLFKTCSTTGRNTYVTTIHKDNFDRTP